MYRSLCLALLLPCCLIAAERPAIPAPSPLPDAQLFALVVIDDLPGLVTKLDALAARFAEKPPAEGALARAWKRMLGDEGVAAIGPGPALIAIGPGGVAPAVALVLPTAQPDLVAQALEGRRRIHVAAAGDAVIIAPQPGGLPLGQGLVPLRAALAVGEAGVDLRCLVAPARILTAYEPLITPGITMLKANFGRQPQGEQILPILLAEIAIARALVAQIDGIAVDLRVEDQAVSGTWTVAAASGTALAAAQVAPTAAWPDGLCRRLGDGPAWLKSAGHLNGPALCDFVADLAASLKDVPEVAPYLDDEVLDALWSWADLWDGTFAQRLHSRPDLPMVMESTIGVSDAERYLALTRTLMDAMLAAGPIADLYTAMGIAGTFTEQARMSGDQPVHRVSYTIDETKLNPAQAEQLRTSLRDLEFALPPGCLVMAQVPADLDRLLAGGAVPMTLTAATAIGPGRDLLMDLDLIGCAKDYATVLPVPWSQPLQEAFAPLAPGEPVVFAWTADQGRSLGEWRVPLQPIIDLIAAGRAAFTAPPPENLQEF